MKKLINDPLAVVPEMLEGAVALAPRQALLEGESVVLRSDIDPDPARRPVALISGGGSGHEPAHAGYVGAGMLTAAVAGDVFTSPSTDAVLAAIRAAAGPAGALLIVKNYTGDRLNFGLAAEMARGEGLPTRTVVVADDVALAQRVEPARRRGIAGTVLVHKIAGAAAAEGRPLEEVARLAQAAADATGSMGVALGACTLPAAGRPGFVLGEDEIELGLGIHGEPGVTRGTLRPVDALADALLSAIVADRGLSAGSRVALLVNGLGGTPPMELAIAARAALGWLAARGLHVERAWSGTLLSALDMPGFSLSLMPVDGARLALLDAPTEAPAWPGGGRLGTGRRIASRPPPAAPAADAGVPPAMVAFRDGVLAAARALIAAEPELTDLDARAGDGDLGASLKRGAEAVRALAPGAWASPAAALAAMADAMRRAIGGSSGPFYAVALMRAGRRLAESGTDLPPSLSDYADALRLAAEAVSALGGAKPGDRTMLDALLPAAEAMAQAASRGAAPAEALTKAAEAARIGAARTAEMSPRLGRASYIGARALGIPDGGAVAVSIWLAALGAGERAE